MPKRVYILTISCLFVFYGIAYSQETEISAYNLKADQYWHINIDSAFYYTEKAYQLSKSSKDSKAISRAMANKGIALYTKENYEEAISFYDSALFLAKKNGFNYTFYIIYKSNALIKLSLYKEAITYLRNEININESEETKIELKVTLLSLYLELGMIQDAKDLIKDIEEEQLIDPRLDTLNYNKWLSKYFSRIAEFNKSNSIAKRLLAHYDSTRNIIDKSTMLLQLGENAMRLGEFDKSFNFLFLANQELETVGYEFGIAESSRLLGSLYSYLGEYEIASKYLFEALEIYENNKNLNEVQKIKYELSWIYYSLKSYEKAEEYIQQSIAIAEKIGNEEYLGKSYNVLGSIYYELGDFNKAIENYIISSKCSNMTQDIKAYSASRFNTAIVYNEIGQEEKALEIYLESYEVDKKLNDNLGMAISEYTLAKFYLNNGQMIKAKSYIKASLGRLEKLKVKRELSTAFQIASDIYEASENYKKANDFLKSYQKLQAEVYQIDKNNAANKLEALYKLKNYEQEIKLLNLEKEVTENDLLIKENTIGNQQKFIYVALFALLLLITLLYISIRFIRIRSKSNKVLLRLNKEVNEKQEEILAQSEELQEANDQISELNIFLEKKVEERTSELTKAKEDLDIFFYKASHDFRGPLTTFMGLAELATISLSEPKALELFERVRFTAVRLDKMVRKLQAISLINTNSLDNNKTEPIDVQKLFKRLEHEFSDLSQEKGVELKFETNSKLIPFYQEHFTILLEVLIENGINHNYNPEPFIQINIKKDNSTLLISAIDNGKGISAEQQEEVFKMFHRGSSESKGNGLGLFLLHKIVEYLDGDIKLQSEVGKGSTFTLTFKLNR